MLSSMAASAQTPFSQESPAAVDLNTSYKAASQPTLAIGETLTYTIHLYNSGSQAAKANVTDKIPEEVQYVAGSASGSGTYDDNIALLAWDNVAVPAQSEVVLSFDVISAAPVGDPTPVTNIASIQMIDESGFGEILNRQVTIELVPEETLAAVKAASQSTLAEGEVLTYTIQVVNSGIEDVSFKVDDPLPAELGYVPGSASGGGRYDDLAHSLSWTGLLLPAGGQMELTFDVTAAATVAVPTDVTNVAHVVAGEISLNPEATIQLVPGVRPSSSDVLLPEVTSMTISDKDVLSNRDVILHIEAIDDVGVAWMFVREWALDDSLGSPYWYLTHMSGWVPFQSEYPWTLQDDSGPHYVDVVVADENYNKSMLTFGSFDFASLVQPNVTTVQPAYIPYLVYYDAGADVSITMATSSGQADLYIWYPENYEEADQASLDQPVDQINFTAPRAGIYMILVHAIEPAVFNIAITPAGGPRMDWSLLYDGIQPSTASVSTEPLTSEPVFSVIGLYPAEMATVPGGPYFARLPFIFRR
jgi:uncharacterized repeat protein (TIGR01451 family)